MHFDLINIYCVRVKQGLCNAEEPGGGERYAGRSKGESGRGRGVGGS
jgi:hypothetical protein